MLRELLPRSRDSHASWLQRPQPSRLSQARVQPKLARGRAAGAAERAADAMADQVMAGQAVTAQGRTPDTQEPGSALSPQVARSLVASKGGGAPLSEGVRSYMEPRFGFDFADVRVHTDERAHAMTQGMSARAFAHGSDIYLAPQVRPEVNSVLAHELAHVTQQTGMVHCMPDQRPRGGVVRRVNAEGKQSYQGDPDTATPDAKLYEKGQLVGFHGGSSRGPTWEFSDGSWVVGNAPSKANVSPNSRKKSDVAWLEILVREAGGPLAGVQRIRRIETSGGSAPSGYGNYSGGNNPDSPIISVPYSCVYEFCA